MRIGVFDSGIGGLTVLKELINKHPNNEYFYFGDTLNLPYGEKDKETLFKLASNTIDFLLTKKVELIVIACGTVSSNVYQELKNKYDIPIINIIDSTIDYLKNKDYKQISVLATKATIKSHVFKKQLPNVIEQECPEFVNMIETNTFNNPNNLNIIKNYLDNIKISDAIVLGCTHYPILEDIIKSYLPNKDIINMGKIIADNLNLKGNNHNVELYFSKITDCLNDNVDFILEGNYEIYLK